MQKTANATTKLESAKCYNGLGRIILGSLITEGQISNNMMIQMQSHVHLQISFVQLDSIVLKLFAHFVVLLLHEQSLQSQNHQQLF
jgi:hypothetical protein